MFQADNMLQLKFFFHTIEKKKKASMFSKSEESPGTDRQSRFSLHIEIKRLNHSYSRPSQPLQSVSQTKEKVRPSAIWVIYLYNRNHTVQIPQLGWAFNLPDLIFRTFVSLGWWKKTNQKKRTTHILRRNIKIKLKKINKAALSAGQINMYRAQGNPSQLSAKVLKIKKAK